MFTEDVFAYYGHKERFGEAAQVLTGRVFVILVTLLAYFIAMRAPAAIFEMASQYAFAGFAALSPLMAAALYWRRSTKWGAFAAAGWVALSVSGIALLQSTVTKAGPVWVVNGVEVLTRTPAGTLVMGYLPVVPITLGSILFIVVVSLATQPPGKDVIARYFHQARS
jgi:Na+/proline symporter